MAFQSPFNKFNTFGAQGTTTPFNVQTVKTPERFNPFANIGILGNPTAQKTITNVIPSPSLGLLAQSPYQNTNPAETSIKGSFLSPQQPSTENKPTSFTTPPPQTTQTPSQFQQPSPQGTYVPNTGLYGQLIAGLANTPQQNPNVQEAIKNIQDLQNQYAQRNAQIMGTPGLGQLEAGGEQGLLNQLFTQKLGAAQTALQNTLTQQGLQQQALQGAAGLATPTAVPYSSQFVSPVTGENVLGGNVGQGLGNPKDAANLYASRVMGGKMTYDQAVQALSSYGPIGQQLLAQALGPDFSTVQSNVNAAIQGQLGPAAQNAANQLNNLRETIATSPGLISSGIPVVNSLSKLFSSLSGIGAGKTQALQSALVDARASMANALGVANNSTPSTYDEYVRTLLPDGLSPDQLNNAIVQFKNQIGGKLQAYSQPGSTQFQFNQQNATANSQWDW